MQSVPITTSVVSSNPSHGEVYSIQHYVIKFVSHLQQVGGFLLIIMWPLHNQSYCNISMKNGSNVIISLWHYSTNIIKRENIIEGLTMEKQVNILLA
jgi:hypothetical protein